MTLKKASDFTDVIGKSSLLSVFLRATVHIICFHRKISQLSGNFSSYKTNSTSSCLTIKLQLWLVPSVKKTLNLTQTRTWLVSQNGSERALSALVGIKDPIIFRRLSDSRIYRVFPHHPFSDVGKVSPTLDQCRRIYRRSPNYGFPYRKLGQFLFSFKGRIAWKTAKFCGKCGVWVHSGGAANAHMYFPERENRTEKTVESLSANRERRRRARLPPKATGEIFRASPLPHRS